MRRHLFLLLTLSCLSPGCGSNSSPPPPEPVPLVENKAAELQFGPWTAKKGLDGIGQPGVWIYATVTNMGQRPIGDSDYETTHFGADGLKIAGDLPSISLPFLNPGEAGEAQIRLDNSAKVVISKKPGT